VQAGVVCAIPGLRSHRERPRAKALPLPVRFSSSERHSGAGTAVQTWRDIHFSARDGLRLYARHYAAPGSSRRPVPCLAGLTRNGRDFHHLAAALARADNGGRDVYTLDSRGRGRSEFDRDWRNYSLLVEVNDALDFMTMAGLAGAGVIGT